MSPARNQHVDQLVGSVHSAKTPRAFVAAFNALLKQACPQRALTLLVMTPETFRRHPDLRPCTLLRNSWGFNKELKGGNPFTQTSEYDEHVFGFYLVEGTSCVASIELYVNGSSDDGSFRRVGNIYAKTRSERQNMDLYGLVMAATVMYAASFKFKYPISAKTSAKLTHLHSEAIVVPSMWVLRHYDWASPEASDFDKEVYDSYGEYQQYFDAVGGRRRHCV